jgi:hypothetical protein
MKWIGRDKFRIGKQGATTDASLGVSGHNMKLIFNRALGKIQYTNNGVSIVDMGTSVTLSLTKVDSESPAFTKTGHSTISVKAGTALLVNGTPISFAADTPVIMPTLVPGTDYAIYFCDDGTVRASDNWSAPAGYTTANSTKAGGFHFGLISTTETVASGSFATTGNGMIWTQADVDKIKGINQFSIWDLKFRPKARDPRGMALVAGQFWTDIYLTGTNHEVNGTSKYNSDVASGTVLPKIPTEYGGNGTATYANGSWYTFNEIARSHGKRFLRNSEFIVAAFGVTENQSLGGAASTITSTGRQAGYTSKYGIEQATGHHWTWGEDSSYQHTGTLTAAEYDVNGGRGKLYLRTSEGLVNVLLGGHRSAAASSGSRASYWYNYPWNSAWSFGLRAACDHLKLS